MRPDRPASQVRAHLVAKPRHKLAVGESRGRLATDLAGVSATIVDLANAPFKALPNGARAEDEEIVGRGEATRDIVDEPGKVFEAVGLAGGLRRPTATVAHEWVVPDVAGRAAVVWHLGLDSVNAGVVVLKADDDGLARVDPDERAWSRHGCFGLVHGNHLASLMRTSARESR